MSDTSNTKFSDWLANLEPPFIFSGSILTFGMILVVLGILQLLNIPTFGTFIPNENYRVGAIIIGLICIFSSPFIYTMLKNNADDGESYKPFLRLFSTKYRNAKLKFGLDHIDNVVSPYYFVEKTSITTVDKKNAMSAILRMISLTTLPSSITSPTTTNICRMSISEVKENGHFSILAAHQIDQHRLEGLENLFNHKNEMPVGVAGHVVNRRKAIKIDDVLHPSPEDKGVHVPTPDNDIPVYKSGSILALPVFEDSAHPSTSKILAVFSVSSSKIKNFNDNHIKDLEEYCNRISILLRYLNNAIKAITSVDPVAIKKSRIITISGQSGSGKTTLTNELLRYLKPLGWKEIQIGKLFRKFCEAKGFSVQEIEKVPPDIHRQFDDWQEETMKYDHNIILEGRLSGYLAYRSELENIKNIFRIFCVLPLEQRVERFANREGTTLKEAEKLVLERDNKDLEAYSVLYGLKDYRDKKYYNLYLDTTKKPDELAKIVFDELNNLDNN